VNREVVEGEQEGKEAEVSIEGAAEEEEEEEACCAVVVRCSVVALSYSWSPSSFPLPSGP
jgi:hypothetical protein